MKLYGATVSWNVTRCVVALEEAGAEYQIVPIDFATAEHKSPDHLARNVRRSQCLFICPAGRSLPAGWSPLLLLLLRDLIFR
jgi:hypothetical protein